MKQEIKMMKVEQPIGTFYVGKIATQVLLKISKVNRRESKSNVGIQRNLEEDKTKEITSYCRDPDAAFPTPIILAMNSEEINMTSSHDIITFSFNDESQFAEILDGQHRIEGIKQASLYPEEMVLVIMLDLTEEEKAYVFSTINSNQKKVDKSLIYDLFELSTKRSPYKTCHEIARLMHRTKDSPFYNRLKMLGKKESPHQTLSQGSFVNSLVDLISKDPRKDMLLLKADKPIEEDRSCVLRRFFINNQDELIYKLLNNYFAAIKETFLVEWENDKQFILVKTTGFGACIKAFPSIYKIGIERKTLSFEFFLEAFSFVKQVLIKEEKQLDSKSFRSGTQGQNELTGFFLQGFNLFDTKKERE